MSYRPKINIEGAGVLHVKSSEILKSDEAQGGGISDRARRAALKVIHNPNLSKAAKTARGSALSQRTVKDAAKRGLVSQVEMRSALAAFSKLRTG